MIDESTPVSAPSPSPVPSPAPLPSTLAHLRRNDETKAPVPGARTRQSFQLGNDLYRYAYLGPVRSMTSHREGIRSEDLFDKLAVLAEPEDWDGLDAEWKGSSRILRNYIKWTFVRARQQDKVVLSKDGGHSAFNTGLSTARQETIYGVFRLNDQPDRQPWVFAGWQVQSKLGFMEHFPRRGGPTS